MLGKLNEQKSFYIKAKKKLTILSTYIPLEIIYGRKYVAWVNWLRESEMWNNEQIEEYQINKLKETFRTAYAHTLYYHRLFDDCGFNVENFRYLDQIRTIPFLTKQIIQQVNDEMVNTQLKKKNMIFYTTGGSTGIPMGMYKNRSDKIKEAAFVNYIWKKNGFKHNAKIAILRGAYTGDRGVFVKEGNRLLISTYDMTEDTMRIIYDGICSFRPRFLHVYPSAINMLSEYMIAHNLAAIPSVECIYTASENLYGYQKLNIEQAFKCEVFDFYGHTEHACMAKQDHDGYSILWQYGFAELVTERDGGLAEIVSTTFDNTAMPLIRYRTLDLVRNAKVDGAKITFDGIEGRGQDFVIAKSGRKVSIAAINMHNDIFDNVKQFQFYQEEYGKCILKLVKNEGYNISDEIRIKKTIGEKLGKDIDLQLLYVREIPRTKAGKYRFIDQRIKDR